MKKQIKNTQDFSRKDALKKIGNYTALTAIGTYLIINPQRAQAASWPAAAGAGF
jgi:hypothetical protein